MPKVDVNKKRGDPNAQIDLQTFWADVPDLKGKTVRNLTGDWKEDFGKLSPRYQDTERDVIVPLGRLEDGTYGVCNLSIDHHLLAAGSALSGLGVFRRATLAHLSKTRTPEQLQIVLIDPLRAMEDFAAMPHLACPWAVRAEEIANTLEWLTAEAERRMQLCEQERTLLYQRNQHVPKAEQEPALLVVISELGEIGIETEAVQAAVLKLMQLARAVELHIVITTQQMSEAWLPESILANSRCRVVFQLPDADLSTRILGDGAASALWGQGDMFFTNGVKRWRMQGFHY